LPAFHAVAEPIQGSGYLGRDHSLTVAEQPASVTDQYQ
jgi:hypothetical protein